MNKKDLQKIIPLVEALKNNLEEKNEFCEEDFLKVKEVFCVDRVYSETKIDFNIPSEMLLAQLKDNLIHKYYFMKVVSMVLESQEMVLKYNLEEKYFVQTAVSHDNSKFSTVEFNGFAAFSNDTSTMTNIKQNYPIGGKMKYVEVHWKNNPHHPEFFQNINAMPYQNIIEMCMDWLSRSIQYNTNFLEWVEQKHLVRFKFPDNTKSLILSFCKDLIKLKNKISFVF